MTRIALMLAITLPLAACSSSNGTDSGTGDGLGWTRLSPQELNDMLAREDVYLVNVHVPYEGEIPGTDAFIPYSDVVARLDEMPTDGDPPLVIYCRSGNMSTETAQALVNAGVTGFFELDGGFLAWEAAGLPFQVN